MGNYQDTEKAVFIFDGRELVRQLLWLEFEAVLDGFVPLVEQASQTVTAVYLTISPGPVVNSAVFFLIDFDKEGYADKRWNLPLEQLAENGAIGPDLGSGPIKMACRSQCSISWHQKQLWDPDLSPDSIHFTIIKNAVKLNRLLFTVVDETKRPDINMQTIVGEAELSRSNVGDEQLKGIVQELRIERDMALAQLKEQNLASKAMEQRKQHELEELKRDNQSRFQEYQLLLQEKEAKIDQQQTEILNLEEQRQGLQQKIDGLKEYFGHKLDSLKNVDKAAIEALQNHHKIELQDKVRDACRELTERLQMRDIEVMYRDTQLSTLQEEVLRLKQEKQSLLENSGNQLLSHLNKNGVSFVTFQPGAGHITLTLDTLSEFIEDRDQFVARKCDVSKDLYQAWLAHFKRPQCIAKTDNGELCNSSLERVAEPGDFTPGVSNYCSKHQLSSLIKKEVSSF